VLRLQIETSLHWPLGSAAGGCQKRGITHLLPAGWKNPRERWGSPVRIDNAAENLKCAESGSMRGDIMFPFRRAAISRTDKRVMAGLRHIPEKERSVK